MSHVSSLHASSKVQRHESAKKSFVTQALAVCRFLIDISQTNSQMRSNGSCTRPKQTGLQSHADVKHQMERICCITPECTILEVLTVETG